MYDNLRLSTVEEYLKLAKDEKKRYTKLNNKLKSLPPNPGLNDLRELRRVALECTSSYRDWRYGVANSTPLKNLATALENVCTRTLADADSRITTYQSEIKTLKAKAKDRKEVAKSSKKLMVYLDKFLDTNPNFFPQRELDCLIALIEDGTLRTIPDLAPYGVTNK